MARNRRNQPAALRFGPVLKAVLICLVIVLCCVGYVWQKKQINLLSEQIKKSERRLADAREQTSKLKRQMAFFLRTDYLESQIKELNLGLAQPKPGQVWWLAEPSTGVAAPAGGVQYASEQTRGQDWP